MRTLSPMTSLVMAVAAVLAVLALGCDATPTGTTVPTFPTAAGPSLPPARETVAPPSDEQPPVLPPSIPPPPSGPPPPPPLAIDYVQPASDLEGFVVAYRAAFGVPELDADVVAQAGARLCTYLQRHTDAAGVVDVDAAVTEADINEPGYPRAAWIGGFGVANDFYCDEFVIKLSEVDG